MASNSQPARRPTVTDVARAAGVSVARSMRSGNTHSIGFVGADISNPFFATAMRGICDVAREEGYEAILMNSDDRLETERNAVRVLLDKQIEGIVVAPTSVTDVEHLKRAQEQGVPVVLLDRQIPMLDTDSVGIDNEAAAREAVEHLIALGHRRIGLLASIDPQERPELVSLPGSRRLIVHGVARPSIDRILATGAAVAEMIQPFGVSIPDATPLALLVRTTKVEVGLVATLNTPRVSLRPTPDGRLVMDSDAAADEVIAHPDGSYEVKEATVEALLAEASAILAGHPELAAASYGVRPKPIPGDGEPALGALEEVPNLFVAFTHSGATLALVVGELLAGEILDGTASPLLDAFRPGRFR